MITDTKGKALRRPTVEAFQSKQFIGLGGIQKGFDISDSNQNSEKTQCQKCSPPLVKPRGTVKLCADCKTDGEHIETVLLENLTRPRKVIKLHKCIACEKCFALSKFSIYFGICRNCFDHRRTPKTARRLAAQAARNLSKIFGGGK